MATLVKNKNELKALIQKKGESMYPNAFPSAFDFDEGNLFENKMILLAGTNFSSMDNAAIDFGKTYNPQSIQADKEYGSSIYEVDNSGTISYAYSEPNIGGHHTNTPSKNPKKTKRVAEVHTHGAYDPEYDQSKNTGKDAKRYGTKDNNDEFSQDDEMRARQKKIISYVATPGGELKKFDPKVHGDEQYELISTQIPSDKKSPNRVNNIDG